MANRLNVLVGAALEQNVEKQLNAELSNLNLNALELEAKFDDNFKNIVDNIKKAIATIDFSKMQDSLGQTTNTVNKIVQGADELSGKLKVVTKVAKDLNGNMKNTVTSFEELNGQKVDIKVNYDDQGAIKDGTITTTDNSEKRRHVQLEKTKKLYEEVKQQILDQKKYLKDTYQYFEDAYDPKILTAFQNKLNANSKALNSEKTSAEKLVEIYEKLSKVKKDANEYVSSVDKQQKSLAVHEDADVRLEDKRIAKLKQVRAEYASLENVIDGFNKEEYDPDIYGKEQKDELNQYKIALSDVHDLLQKEKAETYELEDAIKKLNKARTGTTSLIGSMDSEQSSKNSILDMLKEFNAETRRSAATLGAQYGDSFKLQEFAESRRLGKEILDIVEKQGWNIEACRKAQLKLNSATKDFKIKLSASAKEIKKIEEQAQLLNSSLGRFVQFYGFGELFRGLKTAFTDMFEQIKLVDAGMVELRKVTNETEYAYDKFLTNSAQKAKELGVTISDYIDSVTEFARMGYSFAESQEIAETANIMQMVSENLTADEASEYLISTMAGFKIAAEDSMRIVDALNNVSNNFAITTDGLGEALKRSSASMASANNTLEETIALIATANEVTQNPESVGNALKTVSMNFVALRSNVYRKTCLKRGILNAA